MKSTEKTHSGAKPDQEQIKKLQEENARLRKKADRNQDALRAETARRIEAEKSARTLKEKLVETLESFSDGFFFCDTKWRCLFINETACRILRRKRHELIGKVGWELCSQTLTLKFNPEFHRAIRENVPVHFEEFYPEPLNTWMECHVYPSHEGLAVFLRDITQRKTAEDEIIRSRERMRRLAGELAHANDELEESRKRYRKLIEEVDDLIFESDPSGRIVFVSGRVKDILGYTPDEVTGRLPSEFFESINAIQVRDSLLDVIRREGKIESVEVNLVHKDGHRVAVETNAVPFFNSEGRLLGYRGVTRDITARKSAEESLKLAINAANEPIYDLDLLNGKITWNEAFSAQFGDPPEKGTDVDTWWNAKIHPDDREGVLSCIHNAKQGSNVRSTCDYRFKRRDGIYSFIRDRFHISRDLAGKATRIVGTMMDLTDQKQRESELELINFELKKNAKVLDQILSASPDYISLFDINGTYAYVNDNVAALWGLRKEDIIGRSWRDIGLDAPRTEEFHLKIHKVIDENVTVKGELKYPSSSGLKHFVYTLTPIGEGSRPEGIMLTATDITGIKRTEEALRSSEERLKLASSAGRVGLYEFNFRDQKVYWSPEAYKLYGYEPDTPVDSAMWINCVHPDDRDDVLQVFSNTMEQARKESGVSYKHEFRVLHKDGTVLWLETTGNFEMEHGHLVLRGAVSDVTKSKTFERELQRANEELEDKVRERTSLYKEMNEFLLKEIDERKRTEEYLILAQKNLRELSSEIIIAEEKARQHLATNLHDTVVQSLGAAKLRSQMIQDEVPGKVQPVYSELQDLISESINQARSIMAELSPPVLNQFGFIPALEWLAEQVGSQSELQIKFRGKEGPEKISHEVQVLLFQATRELLTNVLKHSHARKVLVSAVLKNKKIRITVKDNGIGIQGNVVSFRDDKTGFGLFSIRERLRHLGGQLIVESHPGRGTNVTLVSPVAIQ